MAQHELEFLIYRSTDETSAEHIVSQGYIRNAPAIGGQRLDVAKGRSVTRPWQIDISDGPFPSGISEQTGLEEFDSTDGTVPEDITGTPGFEGWTPILQTNSCGSITLEVSSGELLYFGNSAGAGAPEERFLMISKNPMIPTTGGAWEFRARIRRSSNTFGTHYGGISFFHESSGDWVSPSTDAENGISDWLTGVYYRFKEVGDNVQLAWWEVGAGTTEILQQYTSFDSLPLAGEEYIELGVTVTGQDVAFWTEPDGGGERTIRSTGTLISDFLSAGQRYVGINGSIFSAGNADLYYDDVEFGVAGSVPYFTNLLWDGNGRFTLLGRLCELRRSVDGSTMSTVTVGRITDIVDHVSHYQVTVRDERWKERARIFTQQHAAIGNGDQANYSGTILVPAGLTERYGAFAPRLVGYGFQRGMIADVNQRQDNLFLLRVTVGNPPDKALWNTEITKFIREDLKTDAVVNQNSTHGNFNHLVAVVATTPTSSGYTFPIQTFDSRIDGEDTVTPADEIWYPGETIYEGLDIGHTIDIWVVDSTGALSTGDTNRVYLWAPTAEPTRIAPLHIGGQGGIRPFQLLKDIYDEIGVRYSSDAMEDLINDPTFGRAHWRIEQPEDDARQWTEDHLYGPYGVMPLIDGPTGKITPKKIHLPQAVALASLPELTESEVARPYPDWTHSTRDMINTIEFTYTAESQIFTRTTDGDWPADMIRSEERTFTRRHDRVESGALPPVPIRLRLTGVHDYHSVGEPDVEIEPWRGSKIADVISEEIFHRYGDGPQQGSALSALSTADSLATGDFFRISIPTWPSTSGRGGTRVAQVIGKRSNPDGTPIFDYMDAGPALSALSAPTLALAASTEKPLHELVLSVTGTTERVHIEMASGASAPASSSEWIRPGGVYDASTDVRIRPLASGTTWYVRGRAVHERRIRSDWSTTAVQATCTLTAPSALASSSITSKTAQIDWTPGELLYGTEVALAVDSTNSTDAAVVGRLHAGGKTFQLRNLNEDSTHAAFVRHYDIYGGRSSDAALTIETAGTSERPQSPNTGALIVIAGACTSS